MNKILSRFLMAAETLAKMTLPGFAEAETLIKAGVKASGQEKLEAFRKAVKPSLLASENLSEKEFVDEALLDEGLDLVAAGYAKIHKAFGKPAVGVGVVDVG